MGTAFCKANDAVSSQVVISNRRGEHWGWIFPSKACTIQDRSCRALNIAGPSGNVTFQPPVGSLIDNNLNLASGVLSLTGYLLEVGFMSKIKDIPFSPPGRISSNVLVNHLDWKKPLGKTAYYRDFRPEDLAVVWFPPGACTLLYSAINSAYLLFHALCTPSEFFPWQSHGPGNLGESRVKSPSP